MKFFNSLARRIFVALIMIVFANVATAHVEGVTDTSVEIRQSIVYMEYTVPSGELETLRSETGLSSLDAVAAGFVVKNDAEVCPVASLRQQSLVNIGSEQFFLNFDCGAEIQAFSLDYLLMDGLDENHENIVRFSLAGRVKYFLLNAEETQFDVPVRVILDVWVGRSNENGSTSSTDAGELVIAEDFEDGLSGASYYFPVGLTHILMGYDHVLFLIALLLLPFRLKPLIALATSFTVAHSITLGLSVFNYVNLPVLLVEIAIAASIVYVASENLWVLRNTSTTSDFKSPLNRRLVVTFLFGLIHGFGFSYILKEMGLGDQALGALLFFNLGVEVGQLIVIALAFPLLYFIFKTDHGIRFARVGSILVGCVGAFWLAERLLS